MALVFTTFFIMGLGYVVATRTLDRPLATPRTAWVAILGRARRHRPGRRRDPLGQRDRALHVLPAAPGASRVLHRGRAAHRGLVAVGRDDAPDLPRLAARAPDRARAARDARDDRHRHPLAHRHGGRRGRGRWCCSFPGRSASTKTIDPMLARMLFWCFGHPLVYFWLLPAYVVWYTILPQGRRRQAVQRPPGAVGLRAVHDPLDAGRIPPPVHGPGDSRGLEVPAQHAHDVDPVPELRHGVHHHRVARGRRARQGATGLLDWLGKLPWADPTFVERGAGHAALRGRRVRRRDQCGRTAELRSCTTPRGSRGTST